MYSTTLDKHIAKYCKKFGIENVFCDKEFAYYSEKEAISYTIFCYTTDETFINAVNEKYNVDITNFSFIFSLLHEIGHHMTIDELTEEDMENEIFARSIIPLLDDSERMEAYMNLTAEDLATSWAIDYIDSHIEECIKVQKRFLKIIDHIYKKKSFKKVLTKLV